MNNGCAHMQGITRDNHFIPQMYLKRWNDCNKKIHEYKLLVSHENVPKWTEKYTSQVAVFKNLYTRLSPDGELDDFERKFERCFETPAEPAFEKAINELQLTSLDWEVMIDFIAVLYVRTPAAFAYNISSLTQICEEAFQEIVKIIPQYMTAMDENFTCSNNEDVLPIAVKFHKQPDDRTVSFDASMPKGKSAWLYAIKTITEENSLVRNTFKSFKWSIATSHVNVKWPTSDYPVLVLRENVSDNQLMIQCPIRDPNAILFVPISPTKALVTSKRKKLPPRFEMDENESLLYKECIIKNAYSEIYSCFDDGEVETIRPRRVDAEEYKRFKNEQNTFYEEYSKVEGPLLQQP